MAVEYDFLREVFALSKIKSKRTFERKAKSLIKRAFKKNNSFYPYRLALELDRRGYPISELEDYIISLTSRANFNLHYLVLLPLNMSGANVPKLQKAVLETNNAELMAEFARVPTANHSLLESRVLDLKVPRASFLFLYLNKSKQKEKHIEILIKSKKSRYLYKCAQLATNKKDFSLIEDLILKNKSSFYIRLLSTLPFANNLKIENKIISVGNFEEIKKLYKLTKSKNLVKYLLIM